MKNKGITQTSISISLGAIGHLEQEEEEQEEKQILTGRGLST